MPNTKHIFKIIITFQSDWNTRMTNSDVRSSDILNNQRVIVKQLSYHHPYLLIMMNNTYTNTYIEKEKQTERERSVY